MKIIIHPGVCVQFTQKIALMKSFKLKNFILIGQFVHMMDVQNQIKTHSKTF